MAKTAFHGTIVHTFGFNELEILQDAYVVVGDDGVIESVGDKLPAAGVPITELSEHEFLFPGMVDTHLHAGQYENLGIGSEYSLRDWVLHLTNKTEATFHDVSKARTVYDHLVRHTLHNGTTCVAYNSTIHEDATNALSDACFAQGQRAVIGKYIINSNAGDGNIERGTLDQVVEQVERCIQHITQLDPSSRLLYPCLVPRQGACVTAPLMQRLGRVMEAHGGMLHVQSHMCEAEHSASDVLANYPETACQAAVFDDCGLLNSRTVLAHCVHVSTEDLALMKARRAGIAHCPTSNTNLRDGQCRVRKAVEYGVAVGLGSDCSAGHTLSLLSIMRSAIAVSHHLCMATRDESHRIGIAQTLYLATLGGATALGLESTIGNFAVGKTFDAVVVDVGTSIDLLYCEHDWSKKLQKWVFMGDDRSVRRVYVGGKLVVSK